VYPITPTGIKTRIPLLSVIFVAATLLFSGCRSNLLTQPTATPTPEPTATATLPPTPTPLPDMVVLAASGSESSFQTAQSTLQQLAENSGMVFETRPGIETGEITANFKVAVFLDVPGNLPDLLAAAPETQFLVISPVDIQTSPNLTVIRARRENEAFAAGYATALVGYDWRTAGLLPADTALGASLADAFRNGQSFLCGTCTPYYAPFAAFPLVEALPSASTAADWQAGMQEILQSYVYSLYISPEAASPELYNFLTTLNLPIVGGAAPPQEIRPLYAATISTDIATPLRDVWENLINSQGGKSINANIQISDVNPDLLTPGRQMDTERMIQDLTNGLIDPLTPAMQ